MLLTDLDLGFRGERGEVGDQARAGRDDRVGVGSAQVAAVTVLDVTVVVGGPEVRFGVDLRRLAAAGRVRHAVRVPGPGVDQRHQPDRRVDRKFGHVAPAYGAQDLDVVATCRQRGAQIERRLDRSADAKGIVDQEKHLHVCVRVPHG
jgi:hypothetical protein